jgi:hypothetical protein
MTARVRETQVEAACTVCGCCASGLSCLTHTVQMAAANDVAGMAAIYGEVCCAAVRRRAPAAV